LPPEETVEQRRQCTLAERWYWVPSSAINT
jgi:hypothetical protein